MSTTGVGDDENFREAVEASRLVDPMQTFRNLGEAVGIPVEAIVHHALVRWAAAGTEALITVGSAALEDLIAARRRGDWLAVGSIIDWLEAGASGQGYQ